MSLTSNRFDKDHHNSYRAKKGVGFGVWGGFVGAVALTGIIISIPLALGMPTDIFLYALGIGIAATNSDPIIVGTTAFSIILIGGMIVGAIFGFIISRVNALHTSSKRKGIGLVLLAYLIYGAILGGIVTLSYSVHHLAAGRITQEERKEAHRGHYMIALLTSKKSGKMN